MKAILTIGLPGCGKSTWASQQNGFCVVERDEIRHVFFGIFDNPEKSDWYYSATGFGKREGFVTYIFNLLVDVLAAAGRDIIIADTNMNKKYLSKLIERLEGIGYDVEIKEFLDIPLDEVMKRNRNRKASKVVPDDVIRSMYQRVDDIKAFIASEIG